MNKQDKRLLRKYIFTLYLIPYVKLNLIFLAFKWLYLYRYLFINKPLSYYIENEIDRDIVKPYLDAVNNSNKQDFIIIYASVCKVLSERTKNE